MKNFLFIAGFAVSLMLPRPAGACSEDAAAPDPRAAITHSNGAQVVLVGTVQHRGCPVAARELSCTGRVLLTDGDQGAYMIMKNKAAEKLFASLKDSPRVEVTARVFERSGKTMIKVKSFRAAPVTS